MRATPSITSTISASTSRSVPSTCGLGEHAAALGYEHNPIAPGGGEGAAAVGPLVLARDDINAPVRYFPAARADELCGKRWDWIEAIG